MASMPQRIAALSGAVLFLATTVGFTVLVVWQIRQENETRQLEQSLRDSLNQQMGEENSPNQLEVSDNEKLEGTKMKGFSPVDNVAELKVTELTKGTGEEVKSGDTVTVHYTGFTASNGNIFDSSYDRGEPSTFTLNQSSSLIQGWIQGIPGMKSGGIYRLMIPSELAYGDQERSADIPANSDLVFDIEIVGIGG